MPIILAKELDTLTLQDIQVWDRRAVEGTSIIIDVIDKQNLTPERLERLRVLVRQRDQASEPYQLNAEDLGKKLNQLTRKRTPTPSVASSFPSTLKAPPATEEEEADYWNRFCHTKMEKLTRLGGRPSRDVNSDPGPCPSWKSEVNRRYHFSDHWGWEVGRTERELDQWLQFRWHQIKVRANPQHFTNYPNIIQQVQEENKLDWSITLPLPQQTKLDEWREFYIHEARKRFALQQDLGRAKEKREKAREQVARSNHHAPSGRPGVSGSSKDLFLYAQTMARAKEEVTKAQHRLDMLRDESSLSAVAKSMMTLQADEDLRWAQETLQAAYSEEMEELGREFERQRADESLSIQHGIVHDAATVLEQLDTLLKWILDQIGEIASRQSSSDLGTVHDGEVLASWTAYYSHMQDRLISRRIEEEINPWLESDFPDQSGKRLQASLSWLEDEFPNIATAAASCSQGSQGGQSNSNPLEHRVAIPLEQKPPTPNPSPPQLLVPGAKRKTNPNARADVSVRRSKRISKHPSELNDSSLGSIYCLQSLPDSSMSLTVRRSVRLSTRIQEKGLRQRDSNRAQIKRRITARRNGAPQGISKSRPARPIRNRKRI